MTTSSPLTRRAWLALPAATALATLLAQRAAAAQAEVRAGRCKLACLDCDWSLNDAR